MSLLTLIQSVTGRIGITSPLIVATSSDPQIIQLKNIANEEGKNMAAGYPWQCLQVSTTFTTVNTESQGLINTLAPGYKKIINETIWNRDLRRPVFGALSPQQWEQLKAQTMQGPWNQYRIQQGSLNFIPAPMAGQTCAFEYLSKNWIVAIDASTKSAFSSDNDEPLLDEDIMTQGVIWRWKKYKGFEYAEDFNEYQRLKMDAEAGDGGKARLNLNGNRFDIVPAIVITSGSWPV